MLLRRGIAGKCPAHIGAALLDRSGDHLGFISIALRLACSLDQPFGFGQVATEERKAGSYQLEPGIAGMIREPDAHLLRCGRRVAAIDRTQGAHPPQRRGHGILAGRSRQQTTAPPAKHVGLCAHIRQLGRRCLVADARKRGGRPLAVPARDLDARHQCQRGNIIGVRFQEIHQLDACVAPFPFGIITLRLIEARALLRLARGEERERGQHQ